MTGPVGIFGLGLIGNVLARRLMALGHAVIGHDPAPDRVAALEVAGGSAASPAEVWAQAETVLVAVFDTAQVAQVLATAPTGCTALAIVTSTCDPDRLAAIAQGLPGGGLRLAEAPISGTSAQLDQGDAVFLLGGAAADVTAARALLGGIARSCHDLGAIGNGSRAKLAINLVLGLNRAAMAEGLVLAERLGLDPAAFLAVARDSAAASHVMGTKGPRMVAGDFAPEGRVRQSAKDFGLILQNATARGQGLPMAQGYLALMEDCIAAGEADLDNAAIIRAIRRARPAAIPEGETTVVPPRPRGV